MDLRIGERFRLDDDEVVELKEVITMAGQVICRIESLHTGETRLHPIACGELHPIEPAEIEHSLGKHAEAERVKHEHFAVGNVVKGIVKTVVEYGLLVDLEGGIEGLMHVTDMSTDGVAEGFRVGEEVTGEVLEYNPEVERVLLKLGH